MRPLALALFLVAALPAMAAASGPAPSGTLTRLPDAERTVLRVEGVITPALAGDFIGALNAVPPGQPVLVELDSSGGYVQAGYAMIDAVLRQRAGGRSVVTLVHRDAACESMCVGVYMAGFPRRAEAGAAFMVHAPRDERSGALSLRTTNEMKARLIALGTAPDWIQRVSEDGGFSGRTDVRHHAEELVRGGANVVTDLLPAP